MGTTGARQAFFTPLVADPDRVRAARIYPGGGNLDRLVGAKTRRELGWHYPEAWLFSPQPAINPGSARNDEGQTAVYDEEGRLWSWPEYLDRRAQEVLGARGSGGHALEICVKLLDSSCTLPKEYHFRARDEAELRSREGLASLTAPLIKPEAWIRHPRTGDDAGASFIGFADQLTQKQFLELVAGGVGAMESAMNRVTIAPGAAAYVPGGVVHSLGPGLYFEVLAGSDLKVTLQDEFAGRPLSLRERLNGLFRSEEEGMVPAARFAELSAHGQELLRRCLVTPRPLSPERTQIVRTPHFRAEWLTVAPGRTCGVTNSQPHVLVTAWGTGWLEAGSRRARLDTQASASPLPGSSACYGVVMHAATPEYRIGNDGDDELILLAAYGVRTQAS